MTILALEDRETLSVQASVMKMPRDSKNKGGLKLSRRLVELFSELKIFFNQNTGNREGGFQDYWPYKHTNNTKTS